MNWKKINLTNDQVILGESSKIVKVIEPLIIQKEFPIDIAIFSKFNNPSGTETLYLTPQLVQLAGNILDGFKPELCSKPSHIEIGGLLLGQHESIEHFKKS